MVFFCQAVNYFLQVRQAESYGAVAAVIIGKYLVNNYQTNVSLKSFLLSCNAVLIPCALNWWLWNPVLIPLSLTCFFFLDNNAGSSSESQPLFAMSGDGSSGDIQIPAVFLFANEGDILKKAMEIITRKNQGHLRIRLADKAKSQG